MKTLEEIKQEFQNIITKHDKDLEETSKLFDSISEKIELLNNQLITAEEDNDYEEYDKVKKELWTAENTLELVNKKINTLQNKPLISKEEFKQYSDMIKRLDGEKQKELLSKVRLILEDIDIVKKESYESLEEAKKLMATLTKNLCYMQVDDADHPYNRTESGALNLEYSRYNPRNVVGVVLEKHENSIKEFINNFNK
ncbi:hypothetical protein HMPREF2811_05460 [Globicatella sp. HMSC072A10]|uniref:hypothetical protein n=1 Tax=Globicatella sp. HMSC072A10 TaxID=1739315 RepID=UPI0008B8F00B|nr:hypothetical protein [Globicatella sp. HMSC072A10]OFK58537.1 hypothetical protein HMPREF2811_05460 [Globicatella sp. HMSC072A10]